MHATIAPDGSAIAFTSRSAAAQNNLLFIWDRSEAPARLLGREMGFHANPSFSFDGEWVLFAHHPRKGGPPGQHEPGANAQVYRVRRDGTRLEALTDTRGCKVSPVSRDGFELFFIHSTCDLFDGYSQATAGGPEKRLGPTDAKYKVLRLSPDGRHLALIEQRMDTFALWGVELPSSRKRLLVEVEKKTQSPDVAWVEHGHALLLYNGVVSTVSPTGAVRSLAATEAAP